MEDFGFGGFEGITDVAPLDDAASSLPDIGALADAAPIDDALQAAYQDWLGAGNEGTIQDFLTAQEPTQASIDLAPAAFAGQPLESIGDFKPGEIVGLEKSAFAPGAAFGGRFMADAAPAPFGGSFAAPVGPPMPPPAPLPAVVPLDEMFPESAVPYWRQIGTSIKPDIQGPTVPASMFGIRGDLSGDAPFNLGPMGQARGLVVHHTGGGGTPSDIMNVFNQRGLGTQYIMDRDGSVYRALADGTRGRHMRPSEINDLSNQNTVGIEVIAKNDADVTPEQRFGMRNFTNYATERYGIPRENVFGHGELNSHKQATEGMSSVAQWREYKGFGDAPFGGGANNTMVADAGANRPMAARTLMAYAGRDDGESRSAQAPAAPFQSEIAAASRETGIPENVLRAKIRQESGFNPNAVGRAGEVGLTQVKPSTAADPGYGVKPLDAEALKDPAQNIMFGARYLAARGKAAGVMDWNDPKQVAMALTAYNGGGDPNYAQNVMRYMSDSNAASRLAAGDRMRNISPMPQSAPRPVLGARDSSKWGTAADESEFASNAPAKAPATARAAPPPAPQGRMTMPQISPDEELYSMGLVRDPAGGGMIENVAIRPPGMTMGADGAYIDAGAVPAAAASAPVGFGGFGGIASGLSRMFGGGESAAASSASASASRGAGANTGGSWLTPQMDAFLGGLSAALMSNNGAAFAPTYQAILDSANKKAETGSQQAAIAMVLAKQGLPAEEAALLAKSPTAAQMAIDTMKQQREMQQREAGLRQVDAAQNAGAVPAPAPPAAPAPAAPSDGQAPAAQPAPQAPAMSSAEEQRQRLQARRSQLARITSSDPVVKAAIDRQIADIDAQIKAIPDPVARQKAELELKKLQRDIDSDGGGKIKAEIAARREEVVSQGKNPNDPRWESYIMTGKMPREDAQPLTATDKKAILEADEGVLAGETAIKALSDAKKLSPIANSGYFAGARAKLANNLPDALVPDAISSPKSGQATAEYENLVLGQALSQLKSIFGAAPTEGERKILLDLQASVEYAPKVREAILDRAMEAAQKRLDFNKQRAAELRGGDFYKAGDKKGSDKPAPKASPSPKTDPLGLFQ